MIIGPKYKICKRLGAQVFEKCQTQKFQLSESRTLKTKKPRRGGNEFQKQLLEKQKLRLTYGLSEKQFRRYIDTALENHTNPSATLFGLLESRLDSVAFRMGLAPSRRAARQLASHGHLIVNGRRITIPSFRVTTTDAVTIREGSRTSALFVNLAERLGEYRFPTWIAFDPSTLAGSLKEVPALRAGESAVDIEAVFEYYTR
jgi:small subunit ribosomal protein S4